MSDSTFNILSFDGGGIRGALSIKLLEKIQNETPNIVKKSNMISGTSTGSLIALGLAYGMTPSEISNLYSKKIWSIYSINLIHKYQDLNMIIIT